jgi:POTRA domain, FtsQ-type
MSRRRTSISRPSQRSRVLETRIFSRRLMWIACQRWIWRLFKLSLLCGIIVGVCYGAWIFLQRSYLENPEYQLRIVRLNPNTAMNEADVVAVGGISLNSSIFGISLGEVEDRLMARHEIISASVKRELPATIVVEIKERQPFAWIECPTKNMIARDAKQGYVIDHQGFLYACPAMQYDAALCMPIITVAADDADLLIAGTVIETKSLKRSLNLLDVAARVSGSPLPWINRIAPYQKWGFKVWTRDNVEAVFGLEDHDRQMNDLLTSMKYASGKGMQIASINLIPERNFPVVLRSGDQPSAQRVSPKVPVQGVGRSTTDER